VAKKKPKGSRVTPSPRARPPAAAKVPDVASLGQVGRRPSSPTTLFVIAVSWIACGVIALVGLHAAWRVIVGLVFIGIGLFFLRGAFTVVLRHEARHKDQR
jgi:hypothetical protein